MKRKAKSSELQASFFEEQPTQKAVPQENGVKKDYSYIPKDIGLGDMKEFGIYISSINKSVPLTTMEDKQIIETCIKIYQTAYDHICTFKFDKERILKYLTTIGLHEGICYYARVKLGVRLKSDGWVYSSPPYPNGWRLVWGDMPKHCNKPEQMILAISYRLNKLKEIYESMFGNAR